MKDFNINLESLTDDQKEVVFKIGLISIGEAIFDGLPPVDKVRKNISLLSDKTGLSEDEIWECYQFISLASISLGKAQRRESIGFKK